MTGRALSNVTLRGRHLVLFDAFATVGSFVLSLALRFDAPSAQFEQYLNAYVWAIPLLLIARLGAFLTLRLYQRVWRYASIDELVAVVAAVVGSSILGYGAIYVVVLGVPLPLGFPRTVPVIDTTLVIAFAGAWRFALRVFGIGRTGSKTAGSQPAVIVGNGTAVQSVLRELTLNPALGLHPVGILSDELGRGQRLLGVRVLGRVRDLSEGLSANPGAVVLLALPSADGRTLRKIVREAEAAGSRCLTVPSVAEVVAGRVSVNAIREVEFEDLLRRAPSRIDLSSISQSFADRCVLITGAGGSIGAELSRQIEHFAPRRLVLVGRGENSIFEMMQTLGKESQEIEVIPVILDIRDGRRLLRLFQATRPDVVFHAAAHKHVPFMEQYPEEAVATNVLGTLNVLDAAVRSSVEKFVLISTDKAVNPSSVMGATKRIGELLVQSVAREHRVAYTSVRFGNVLSSRGSVVPLFRRQLAEGGPITVTDPEATRYFMTIPEAVQLVLQAAVLAIPGDTFVLDMGEPVRIVQLARDLIEIHGLRPDQDVEVKFIGQRPGEKLSEELFFAFESPEPTTHEAIRRVRLNGAEANDPWAAAGRLVELAKDASRDDILDALRRIVPEYRPPGWPNQAAPEHKESYELHRPS
jgi:FlaA1/EpsC-like NDP-sugar epimerase